MIFFYIHCSDSFGIYPDMWIRNFLILLYPIWLSHYNIITYFKIHLFLYDFESCLYGILNFHKQFVLFLNFFSCSICMSHLKPINTKLFSLKKGVSWHLVGYIPPQWFPFFKNVLHLLPVYSFKSFFIQIQIFIQILFKIFIQIFIQIFNLNFLDTEKNIFYWVCFKFIN